MIIPERSLRLPWSPKTISSTQDFERFDRALSELEDEDQWINDFIKTSQLRGRGNRPQKMSFPMPEDRDAKVTRMSRRTLAPEGLGQISISVSGAHMN